MKIEKKSIMPLLVGIVVMLAGFNTHAILGH
jgi:hypothetical protein